MYLLLLFFMIIFSLPCEIVIWHLGERALSELWTHCIVASTMTQSRGGKRIGMYLQKEKATRRQMQFRPSRKGKFI